MDMNSVADGTAGLRGTKIVLAKAGLDAHERGVHVIALGLRDAGADVVYLGLRQTPREVVTAAVQEDADFIGVSSLAGSHLGYIRQLNVELAAQDCCALVVLGGVIQPEEVDELTELGVRAIFMPGSMMRDIVVELARLRHGRVRRD
jgi:methylmalonyl-CoA mutase, C-terminal domain